MYLVHPAVMEQGLNITGSLRALGSSLTIKGCVRVSVCNTILHDHPTLSLVVRIKHLNAPSQCSDSELNI